MKLILEKCSLTNCKSVHMSQKLVSTSRCPLRCVLHWKQPRSQAHSLFPPCQGGLADTKNVMSLSPRNVCADDRLLIHLAFKKEKKCETMHCIWGASTWFASSCNDFINGSRAAAQSKSYCNCPVADPGEGQPPFFGNSAVSVNRWNYQS